MPQIHEAYPHLIGSRLAISLRENILLIKGVVSGLIIPVVFIIWFILVKLSWWFETAKRLFLRALHNSLSLCPLVLISKISELFLEKGKDSKKLAMCLSELNLLIYYPIFFSENASPFASSSECIQYKTADCGFTSCYLL